MGLLRTAEGLGVEGDAADAEASQRFVRAVLSEAESSRWGAGRRTKSWSA